MRTASIVCLLTLASSLARAQAPSMAVLPLRVEGLQSNEVETLNDLVRERAGQRYDVQAKETTTQLLEASQSLGLDCDVNAASCGRKVGTIADVSFVLLGTAGGLDDVVGVDLRIVDVKLGVEVRRVSGLVSKEPEAQAAGIAALADVLFSATALGALVVRVQPEGAEIVVDGVLRGTAPLSTAITTLAPGEHHVMVRKKGYITHQLRQRVALEGASVVDVTLVVDPDAVQRSGLQAALPWVTLGVGAATAIGGAVLTVFGSQSWYEYEAQRKRISDTVDLGADDGLDDGEIATISDAYGKAETAQGAWESSGQAMVVGGAVMIGIGTVAAGIGAVWGVLTLE